MRRLFLALAVVLGSAVGVSAQQRLAPPKVTTLTGLHGNQGDIVNLIGTGDYLCAAATCSVAGNWTLIGGVAGTTPGGTGSQIQYRSDATTFGGVSGSSVSGPQVNVTTLGVGTAPLASSGDVRLSNRVNAGGIAARNFTDDGDLFLLYPGLIGAMNPVDSVVVGSGGDFPLVLDAQTLVSGATVLDDPSGISDNQGALVLGPNTVTNTAGGASYFALIGSGNIFTIANTDAEAVYVVGNDNLVTADIYGAYAFGEDNVLGAIDPSRRMFAFGGSNHIDGIRGFAFGFENVITHTDVTLFGRGLAETGANQMWFGDAARPVFFQTGGGSAAFSFAGGPTTFDNAVTAGVYITATTSPVVANIGANSCGTSAASIAGTDNAPVITTGSVSWTACRITFDTTAPVGWNCVFTNGSTHTLAATPYQSGFTTTTADITASTLGVAADVLTGVCFAR